MGGQGGLGAGEGGFEQISVTAGCGGWPQPPVLARCSAQRLCRLSLPLPHPFSAAVPVDHMNRRAPPPPPPPAACIAARMTVPPVPPGRRLRGHFSVTTVPRSFSCASLSITAGVTRCVAQVRRLAVALKQRGPLQTPAPLPSPCAAAAPFLWRETRRRRGQLGPPGRAGARHQADAALGGSRMGSAAGRPVWASRMWSGAGSSRALCHTSTRPGASCAAATTGSDRKVMPGS